MSNPLIEKYFEIYPEKKEKPELPKPPVVEYFDEVGSLSPQEVIEKLGQLQPNSSSVTTPTTANPYPPSAITAANHISKLTSYDTHSTENYFLEVAEKIKNKNAKVTSITLNSDRAGLFTTGMTTVTFEVQVYDIP